MGYTGEAINIPWGLNVDGNDDVRVWQYVGPFCDAPGRGQHRRTSRRTERNGAVLHVFKSGSIQMVTERGD